MSRVHTSAKSVISNSFLKIVRLCNSNCLDDMEPESKNDRLKGVHLNLQPAAPAAPATPSAAAVLSIDVPYSCNSISNVQYRHTNGKDPSMTPVMWVLLW